MIIVMLSSISTMVTRSWLEDSAFCGELRPVVSMCFSGISVFETNILVSAGLDTWS